MADFALGEWSPPFFQTSLSNHKIPYMGGNQRPVIMKRLLSFLFALPLFAPMGMAIPADPEAKTAWQPDGTQLTVMLRGDENGHLYLADDGTPLFYNSASHCFEYAAIDGNQLIGSGLLAHNSNLRDARQREYVASIDVASVTNAITIKAKAKANKSDSPRRMRINNFPTIGHQKSLVILFQFSDTKFTSISDPRQFYDDLLNKQGFTHSNGADGSAYDFYHTASYGLFDPEFVVYGPATLSESQTYYGSDDEGTDFRMAEAVKEACVALDDEIDFSEYDSDGDGAVDNIYFFYAGGGEADDPNGTDYIWPHSAHMTTDWDTELSLDGVQIDRYACSNELRYNANGDKIPTGIGTFVHEFAHVLGLADHYDTSYGLLTFGLSTWDTMASGSYNNNMNTPPTFSAFERAELGWLDYEELTLDADTISVLPYLADCNKAYRVSVEGTDGREFFVMENRQKRDWDKYIPGEGMLLWHIDIDTLAWKDNYINVQMSHQRIDIEEADGVQTDATRSGDTFPGASGVSSWQLSSWDGDELIKLDDVSLRADTIRLLPANTGYKIAAPEEITVTEVQDSSFVMTWSKVDDAKFYTVSAYTIGSDGSRQYLNSLANKQFLDVDTVKVSQLIPNTLYYIEATAGIASYTSTTTTAQAQTLDLDFSKRQPTGTKATLSGYDGFIASWDAVRDAEDYQISLYKHGYSTTESVDGYDFIDKYDGLPALWNTSSNTYYSVDGYYGADSPSLRLSSDGDYLVVAYPESLVDKVSFWSRSSKSGNQLLVEKQNGGTWTEAETLDIPTTAKTLTVAVDGADKVRLSLKRNAGYVCIDDVEVTYRQTERNIVSGYDGISTNKATQYEFSGLAEGATYSFRVRGKQGDILSYPSDECVVTLADYVETDTISVGYSNGEVAESSSIYMNGKGWVECAVRLTPNSVAAYDGNDIVAIKAGLVARVNVDTLRVWVRSSLDGENLAEGTAVKVGTEGIYKGWNNVALDSPYDLSQANVDLFIGYSLHQKANVRATSVVGDPLANTSYLKLGTADWKDISDEGVLSIEAIVAGENVPKYDLGLNAATISPDPSYSATALKVEASLHNYGLADIKGFTLAVLADGRDKVETHISQEIASTANARVKFDIEPLQDYDENTLWTISIIGIDDAADEYAGNNDMDATYAYLRNPLIEEFTTEECPNCPRVGGFLQEIMAMDTYKERVNVVTHHAGYYTDKFTQPCDEELTWLYASNGSTYAPAIMLDRQPYFAQSGYAATATCPSSLDDLVEYIDYEMTVKANAVVGLNLEFNADSTSVTANVNCIHNANYISENPYLCVYLLENDIATTDQSGATGTYMQQHVNRAYNSTWGEPVEWTDNTFTYSYTFSLDASWVKKNMQVVAMLYNYNPDDNTDCVVDNSIGVKLIPDMNTDGIVSTISNNDTYEVARYSLDGRKVDSQTRGIVIVKLSDGTCRKVVK